MCLKSFVLGFFLECIPQVSNKSQTVFNKRMEELWLKKELPKIDRRRFALLIRNT